uniref:Uncharacterized protein n=1 Tax=Meloidogyne enterolobii TaxID=390850 RepID=A0A6V7VAL7_MELEN|nr:unnamed protein product [Meloidogyne enterolobii]
MKFARSLIISIFSWILWISVKTTPTKKGLAKHGGKDSIAKDPAKILRDVAESSANPQIQKNKETLTKTDKDRNDVEDKGFTKSEQNKKNYQKNRERVLECKRKYREQNKEKIKEKNQNYYKMNRSARIQHMKIYYHKNKETIMKRKKIYNQNNKEKWNKYMREYRQRKKSQSDNNEGTSFVNPQTGDFINKGKLPIVCEEEGNLLNQGEEECNKGEDEQNQIEVDEANKILEENTNDLDDLDANKKIHSFDLNEIPFDLNEKPEDEELENY